MPFGIKFLKKSGAKKEEKPSISEEEILSELEGKEQKKIKEESSSDEIVSPEELEEVIRKIL